MSRDTAIKWSIIASMLFLGYMLVARMDLVFPPKDFFRPLAIAALLGTFAAYYHRNGTTSFVICLHALAQVVIYTAIYTVVMYSLAVSAAPLVDAKLAIADRFLGIHVPTVVEWTRARPSLHRWLFVAYDSLSIQTAMVIGLLALSNDRKTLEDYVLQFMISTAIAVVVFGMTPAMGPCVHFGYEATAAQAGYIHHLQELRSGERLVATWRNAEGLITFPSFHTTWAILLAWACRKRRVLNVAMWFLNATVVVSTVALGWHYAVDVPGGILLAIVAICLSRLSHPIRYRSNGEPRLIAE